MVCSFVMLRLHYRTSKRVTSCRKVYCLVPCSDQTSVLDCNKNKDEWSAATDLLTNWPQNTKATFK